MDQFFDVPVVEVPAPLNLSFPVKVCSDPSTCGNILKVTWVFSENEHI